MLFVAFCVNVASRRSCRGPVVGAFVPAEETLRCFWNSFKITSLSDSDRLNTRVECLEVRFGLSVLSEATVVAPTHIQPSVSRWADIVLSLRRQTKQTSIRRRRDDGGEGGL